MKQKFLSFIFLTLSFFFLSCQGRRELPPEVVETMVTIHSINTTHLNGKLFIPMKVDDVTIYVSRLPIMTNKYMVHAEPFQYTDDKWGLKLKLTFAGAMRWNQASVEYRGLKVVLATGGKFKCLVTVGREKNPEDVKIAAEFTKEEAEEISKNIIRNYAAIKEIE